MRARIYQPPKNAMQSGWAGDARMGAGVRAVFAAPARSADGLDRQRRHPGAGTAAVPTREEAVAYAERNGIRYDLELPLSRHIKPKAYADNFRYGRIENWTH